MQNKMIRAEYRISADHPCLAGHFPGDPVIPAVLLLDYARRLLQQWQPDKRLVGIPQSKFRQPLRPEEDFSIHLTELNGQTIRFECLRADETLASGLFDVEVTQ